MTKKTLLILVFDGSNLKYPFCPVKENKSHICHFSSDQDEIWLLCVKTAWVALDLVGVVGVVRVVGEVWVVVS